MRRRLGRRPLAHALRALETAQLAYTDLAPTGVQDGTIRDIVRLSFTASPRHLWEAIWYETRDPHLRYHPGLMDLLQALATREGWAPAPLPPLLSPPTMCWSTSPLRTS